jgi:hypothetical protein
MDDDDDDDDSFGDSFVVSSVSFTTNNNTVRLVSFQISTRLLVSQAQSHTHTHTFLPLHCASLPFSFGRSTESSISNHHRFLFFVA